ncbi:MAG: hypothetical protein R3F43_10090, partial [bacterium]
ERIIMQRGGGRPVRANLMQCGPSGLTAQALLEPGDGLAAVEACNPDGNTQAVLIPRDGLAQVNGPEFLAYLNAGGIAITEYNISDDVYNRIFGANVREGQGFGNCSDNINVPVRFNEADPFWQANGALPVEANPGCGMDMSQWGVPMVRLGGWNANTVSLAYVEVGLGRLWLVESDWQDGEESFNAASRQLLRYMIFNGDAGGGGGPVCGDGNVDPGEQCDDGNLANGDGCNARCQREGGGGFALAGQFGVGEGPPWADSAAVSCVSACAQLFGGEAGEYACSTTPNEVNHQAWVSGWGDGSHCIGGPGGPVAEDFVLPGEGQPYDCGAPGCSFSAYVADHCGPDSVNFCYRQQPCAGEVWGGVCLVHLSAECVQGSVIDYCAANGGQVITFAEFQAMVAGGWQRPNANYHTMAVAEYDQCPGDNGFSDVRIPGFGNLDIWNCGEEARTTATRHGLRRAVARLRPGRRLGASPPRRGSPRPADREPAVRDRRADAQSESPTTSRIGLTRHALRRQSAAS